MRARRLPPALLLCGLLPGLLAGGCTVGPDFHAPQVASPPLWGPEPADVASRTVAGPVDPRWWESFHDPELTSLVGRLVAQNLDLQAATERITQEREQRRVAASQGLPHVDEQSSYKYNRQSPAGFLSLVTPAPYAPLNYDIWQNALSVSWDLDLFGRVRRSVEGAQADVVVAIEDRRGIALSALAELAQDYLQLRGTQARLDVAERNLALARQNTALVRARFANGVATTLDMAQAAAQQAGISGTLPVLRTQQAALINAIGLLLAQPPRALEGELAPRARVPGVPPTVPVGLPGALVRRRPDVVQAEARLHSATAQTGVAVAQFYPDVTLTGMADLDGRKAVNAFSLPDYGVQIGPTFSIPLFRGGELTGRLHVRQSQQREAAIAFQRTVLRAWREVDDALTAYAQAQRQRVDVAEAARQDQAALDAARQRYVEGAADFLNVNTTQAQLLQAQDELASVDTQIATDLVTLYRALGGGWEAAEGGLGR